MFPTNTCTSASDSQVNREENVLPEFHPTAQGQGERRRKGKVRRRRETCLPAYASAPLHQINFTLSHLPVLMMSFIHQFAVAMATLASVVLDVAVLRRRGLAREREPFSCDRDRPTPFHSVRCECSKHPPPPTDSHLTCGLCSRSEAISKTRERLTSLKE